MNNNGWNDSDDIVWHLKMLLLTASMMVVLVIVLAIYEPDTSISQPQAQTITENTRDAYVLKCEK